MVQIGDGRIKSGMQICIESLQLLYKNPVIGAYIGLQAVMNILFAIAAHYVNHTDIIAGLITLFLNFCIARHAMHILCQQSAGMHESFVWIFHHLKQVILWIFVLPLLFFSGLLLILISWSLFGSITVAVPLLDRAVGALVVVTILLYAVCFSLFSGIVIPILATEKISICAALKRSLHVVWNNLGTYIAMLCFQVLIMVVLFLVSLALLSIFFTVATRPYVELLAMPFMFLLTIGKTIFYYIFYVKLELELAEISITQQM